MKSVLLKTRPRERTIERMPLRLLRAAGVGASAIGMRAAKTTIYMMGQSQCEPIAHRGRGFHVWADSVIMDDGLVVVRSLALRRDPDGDELLRWRQSTADAHGTLTLRHRLPETVITAAVGRPLGGIISLRRVRLDDIIVEAAWLDDQGTGFRLTKRVEKVS